MKDWKPDENGDLDELFGLAGIPPSERPAKKYPPEPEPPEHPNCRNEELVTLSRSDYNWLLREFRNLQGEIRAVRSKLWLWFAWGLVIGSILYSAGQKVGWLE